MMQRMSSLWEEQWILWHSLQRLWDINCDTKSEIIDKFYENHVAGRNHTVVVLLTFYCQEIRDIKMAAQGPSVIVLIPLSFDGLVICHLWKTEILLTQFWLQVENNRRHTMQIYWQNNPLGRQYDLLTGYILYCIWHGLCSALCNMIRVLILIHSSESRYIQKHWKTKMNKSCTFYL